MKFGFRKNHFYPLMLLLFIFLRKALEQVFKRHPYGENIDFLIPFLIFFSQGLIGSIIHLYYIKVYPKGSRTINYTPFKIGDIKIIQNRSYLSNDSKKKIGFLIAFTSFFNFIGCIMRTDDVKTPGKEVYDNKQLDSRIRSIQIILSAFLCYFALRLNMYNHQKVSLVIISFFWIALIVIEIYISEDIENKIIAILICITSNLLRAYLDVAEKYLFDFDYINIIKMLIYEGFVSLLLYIAYFISYKPFQVEAQILLTDMSTINGNFISFILLVIFYIIISGFRNAYRVTTNKYYSPMSRALFESTLDPFLFLYKSLMYDKRDSYKGYWIYFPVVLFCLTVIAFFSLVYNDFIILYCCGLERNTYSEITSRLYLEQVERIKSNGDDNDSYIYAAEDKDAGSSSTDDWIELDLEKLGKK